MGRYIKNIYNRFSYHMVSSRGAEISFYLLLSFFPFLIFLITLISYIPVIHLNIYVFSKFMPSSAYNIVLYIVNKAVSERSINFLILSFFMMIWSSTNGVRALIRGINKAYDLRESRSYFKVSTISLVFTAEIIFLIVFSLGLIIYGEKLGVFIFQFFGLERMFLFIWNSMRYIIWLLAMVFVFVSLYLYTPNHKISMGNAIPGAIVATIGWIIVSLIFSYYANNYGNYSLLYGSIGGIIALLSWIYLSSVIILIGAEVNAVFYFRNNKIIKIKSMKN
jgi:membrane protein